MAERRGYPALAPGWPALQAHAEVPQSVNVHTGDGIIRRTSQCPQNVEDVVTYVDRNQGPYFPILELAQVHDKGLEHTLGSK